MQRAFELSEHIRYVDDAIVLADDENRILFTNTATERLFSYDHDEIAGKDFRLLLAHPYRTGTPADLSLTLIRRPGTTMRQVAQLNGLRKDGREFPLELSSLKWKINGSDFYAYLTHDMSNNCQEPRRSRDTNILEIPSIHL